MALIPEFISKPNLAKDFRGVAFEMAASNNLLFGAFHSTLLHFLQVALACL